MVVIGYVSYHSLKGVVKVVKVHLASSRHPIFSDTGEERLLVLLDPPHICKVFRQLKANGVSEEVAEAGGEA